MVGVGSERGEKQKKKKGRRIGFEEAKWGTQTHHSLLPLPYVRGRL
jgi:hypothetical protein